MAFGMRELAGPDPLHAQRRFTPAFGGAPSCIRRPDPGAGAGDFGERFRPEFERHAGLDWEEIKFRAGKLDVREFGVHRAVIMMSGGEGLAFGFRREPD